MDSLFQTLTRVSLNTNKRAIIAENSYPFTFSWADWTDNVMGWEGDLHPNYAATTNGQFQQVNDLIKGVRNSSHPLRDHDRRE
jgi:arabinogalactan endo-1,4-beta-galactosidase